MRKAALAVCWLSNAVLVPIILLLASSLAACGDTSEAESYFEDLQRLNDSEPLDQRRADFQAVMPDLVERPEEAVITVEEREEVAALYRALADDWTAVVAGLASMSPPDELLTVHEEFTRRHTASAERFRKLADEVNAAETRAELAALLTADDLAHEANRLGEAADTLVSEAESRGFSLDLLNLGGQRQRVPAATPLREPG